MPSLDELFLEAYPDWCLVSLAENPHSISWTCCLSSKHEIGHIVYGMVITPNDAINMALHDPISSFAHGASLPSVSGPSLAAVMRDFLILPKPKINAACVRRF